MIDELIIKQYEDKNSEFSQIRWVLRCHFGFFPANIRRKSDYLIGYQVKAAPILKRTQLEIIPTVYILK
jgi:hypothetical protein